MIDVGLPRYADDYNGYFLMKFTTSYEFQQEFLDGKLYFNTSDFFAKCDENGRGDYHEGSTFIVDYEKPNLMSVNLEKIGNDYAIVARDYSQNPEKYKKGTIWAYSAAENRRRKIIAIYTAFVNTENQVVSPFDNRMKKEFGQFGILILNRQVFFERVVSVLSKQREYIQTMLGFVKYIPDEKMQGLIDWNPFFKKEKFAYQNEFRMTFISGDNEPIKIDLGTTIRDIAVPIDINDLDKIHMENGKLFYPIYD